ncbi:sensor histidine kinase [Pedobacter jejuensis]|uniref:sensor histidine kinase n=1 Tax=Pedobacter jejuensis TaxID=1268550 RepID=UPI0038B2A2C3
MKYTPSGGEINIASKIIDDRIRISITDHGIGIPKKDFDIIFDRLYRIGSSGVIKGLGFGLYICQKIIQQLGGTITVESEEGIGSTFSFELPYPNK